MKRVMICLTLLMLLCLNAFAEDSSYLVSDESETSHISSAFPNKAQVFRV